MAETASKRALKTNQIVMNFSVPPSLDDMTAMAHEAIEFIPEDIKRYVGDFSIEVQDFPDLDIEDELELDSPYDQLAYFKPISTPSTIKGNTAAGKGDADILYVYRRPLLDLWCETEEDLGDILQRCIIEELGHHCGFNDDEVDAMLATL